MMQLTPHFWLSEFASNVRELCEKGCKGPTPVPARYRRNVERLVAELEVLRAELGGRPITVISGYRTPAHNRHSDGVSHSQHLVAKAADIRVRGVAPRKVAETIRRLIREGRMRQGGVGQYRTFTHYDIRGTAARWSGSA